MGDEIFFPSRRACWWIIAIFVFGLLILASRLKSVQVDSEVASVSEVDKQSVRLVQTDGVRGRILDRHGEILAGNRSSYSIALNAAQFKKSTTRATASAIREAIENVSRKINREISISDRDIERHLAQTLARPFVVWRDVDQLTLAKFCENQLDFPGFIYLESEERVYPNGPLAAHVLGYVGRDRTQGGAGDVAFRYYDLEMRGRAGVEHYYDSFLRGMPGELKLRVDARGFVHDESVVVAGQRGPDLYLTLDASIQRVVEAQLARQKGACVVMDPRTGEILAFASAPGFNPNDLVPTFPRALYDQLTTDPAKPLLNRASAGSYAPGSTFKPITALASLCAGESPTKTYECIGSFMCGKMRIRCARTWGHGDLNLRTALRDSCNAYFCQCGMRIGTNLLAKTARAFGLGAKTGIDFSTDHAGVVPDETWKLEHYREKWYPGDLAQMAIGQGMLLVTPLQMARVAGALGTGALVTPHLKMGLSRPPEPLPFASEDLAIVRDGMRLVVNGGTGRHAGENVNAWVIGKTGTAEIGRGATRRKNTWFIAYAESCAWNEKRESVRVAKPEKVVAVAMIVENGESGGGTTAPKVGAVLREIFATEKIATEKIAKNGTIAKNQKIAKGGFRDAR